MMQQRLCQLVTLIAMLLQKKLLRKISLLILFALPRG
jgi:hypothetical protein